MNNMNKVLQTDLSALRLERKKQSTIIKQLRGENNRLNKELAEITLSFESASKKLTRNTAKMEEFMADNTRLKAVMKDLELRSKKERLTNKGTIRELDLLSKRLHKELEALKVVHKETSEDLDSFRTRAIEAESELVVERESYKHMDEKHRKKIADLETKYFEAKTNWEKYQEHFETLTAEHTELQQDHKEATTDLRKTKKAYNKHKTMTKFKIAGLNTKVNKMAKLITQVNTENAKSAVALKEAQIQATQQARGKKAILIEYKELSDAYEKAQKRHDEYYELQKQLAQAHRTRNQMEGLEDELTLLRQQKEDAIKAKEVAEHEKDESELQESQVSMLLDSKVKTMKELFMSVTELRARTVELQDEHEPLVSKHNELVKQLELTKHNLEESNSKQERYKKDLSKLKEKYLELEKHRYEDQALLKKMKEAEIDNTHKTRDALHSLTQTRESLEAAKEKIERYELALTQELTQPYEEMDLGTMDTTNVEAALVMVKRLKAENERRVRDCKNVRHAFSLGEREHTKTKKSLEERNDTIRQTFEQYTAADAQKSLLQQELSDFMIYKERAEVAEKQFKETAEELSKVSNAILRAKNEVQEYKHQHQVMAEANKALAKDRHALRCFSFTSDYTLDVTKANERIQFLVHREEDLTHQIKNLTTRNRILGDQLQSTEQELRVVQADVATLETTISRFRDQVSSTQQAERSANQMAMSLQAQIEELHERFQAHNELQKNKHQILQDQNRDDLADLGFFSEKGAAVEGDELNENGEYVDSNKQ